MNRNSRFLFTIVATFSMLISLVVVFANNNIENKTFNFLSGDPYTRAVNDVTSSSLLLNNDYQVSLESSGFTDGSLFTLSSKGYIRNTEPIRGITSISLTYEDGSDQVKIVPCYYDYETDAVVTPDSEWPSKSSSADFTSSPIDYFELYNPNGTDVTITSITISYGCTTSSYTFGVSFTPNWNGKTADTHADIYIAGTQELVSNGTKDGNWYYKKLDYSAGTYSYTSPTSLPTGKYAYSFYAVEHDTSFSWSNKCSEGNISLFLDGNTIDSTNYSWTSEPGYEAESTYTLHLNVTSTGTPSSFGNMQFVYTYTSATADDFTWGEYIANGKWSNSYEYSKEGLDATVPLYFRIYMWSDGKNVHVAKDESWTNFTITPSGVSDEYINVSFAYTTPGDEYTLIIGSATQVVKVSSVSLNKSSINLVAGDTETLSATISPNDATNKNVTWSTSNSVVATVSEGVVTARSAGNAVISVTTEDGNKVASCNVTVESADKSTTMSFANQNTTVYGSRIEILPTFDKDADSFTASYSGENIRIDDNRYITGLKAGTSTTVTLNSVGGLSCTFKVNVASSTYSASRDLKWCETGQAISVTEGWFNSTTVSEISNMDEDFMNGIDVSSAKALYDNGTKFYNSNGVEQSLFYILKDAGVNWIRLKLWVDPFTTGGLSYGGGGGDIDSTLWMAYEAKAAGMKLLLDFHYSDYWTHPAQQILPKAWADASSANDLANYIKNYTKDTLETFNDNNCLPDMVQLGNEISSGSFLNLPGSNSESFDGASYVPGYLYNISGYKSSGNYTLSRNFTYNGYGSANMNTYLSAGVNAVKEINTALSSNIKTVVHWAKGSTIDAGTINSFFSSITADYDYAAISYYPFYCFDTMATGKNILNGLSISKPWFVAETSYPFSGHGYVYENGQDVTKFSINDWNPGNNISSEYAFNAAGQANLIHDLTKAVVDANGLGVFYWEGAWVPNINVGWSGPGSLNSWGNQGFFSFDGKAIANLNLFKQMSPHI